MGLWSTWSHEKSLDLVKEDCTRWSFEVPDKPNHSVILWKGKRKQREGVRHSIQIYKLTVLMSTNKGDTRDSRSQWLGPPAIGELLQHQAQTSNPYCEGEMWDHLFIMLHSALWALLIVCLHYSCCANRERVLFPGHVISTAFCCFYFRQILGLSIAY